MYIAYWLYSKTCFKRPLKKRRPIIAFNGGQKYCRMLQGEHSAILFTFIKLPFVIKIAVRWLFFIKVRFFTTKKDGSTGPTALESDGPYFEIMRQWPGPTTNLTAWICKYKVKINCNYLIHEFEHVLHAWKTPTTYLVTGTCHKLFLWKIRRVYL